MTGLTFTHEKLDLGNERRPPQHLWMLRGPLGVVQFKAGPCRRDCTTCRAFPSISHFDPDGRCWYAWDLGYHSPIPRYDGQEPWSTNCDILPGVCYYDGTGLGAGELLDAWFEHGASLPWLEEQLTVWYRRWFESEDEVFASPVTAFITAVERAVGGDAQ